MGKINKAGFAFVEYANAGLIRKIDDMPVLKHELIALSETKTHPQMSAYALLLGEHVLAAGGLERTPLVQECFDIIVKWQRKEVHFRRALDIAGKLNDLARTETNPIRVKALRAMGQIAATPHVRWHPLVASEYAVVMTNLMYPKDLGKVREEREKQIALMQSI